ncbi:MAG: type II toxin-antitoxin system VapC family toxin [Coxiellaceae bacterium]|nr:type II toxin-antitoxin system VapC family toxin [Coxiellaceae bacterium]
MSGIILDTHAWIWYANKDHSITKTTRQKIHQAGIDHQLYIASISLWEIAMLVAHKRITISMPYLEWIETSMHHMMLQSIALTPQIANDSCELLGKFHGDPADRLIVASTRVNNLTLVTKDKAIVRYAKDKYVKVLAL